jgi:transketolase
MLRAIPNFAVIRPSSVNELREAWKRILSDRKPVGLVLSRQDLANPEISVSARKKVLKGGYCVFENLQFSVPNLVIIATGSEVDVAIQASKILAEKEISTRVVSMLSFEWFKEQDQNYKDSVLGPKSVPKLTLEAASTFGWDQFIGDHGFSIGIDEFGESGDGSELLRKFGITPENVVEKSLTILSQASEVSGK